MSFDTKINAYFVVTVANNQKTSIKNYDKILKNFDKAYECLKKHIDSDRIRHLRASEGFPLIASGQLNKKDVFVFDCFEGDFFRQLQQTKCLIVGPSCLIACLQKYEPIPLGPSPIYSVAMRDLQISASGITQLEKERLRTLIQWMGGHYFQNFGRSITHLITNTVKSAKYEHATLNSIPVMHVDWVQRVWEKSSADDISATDHEFDKYKLPIFFDTNITCTNLDTEKKNEIMRLVNENGGTYHRAFRSQLVDIVITEKDKTNSDKYQAAIRYKKEVLVPEWIFDSVEKGFALPTKDYQVKSLKVSTPTKEDQTLADFMSNDQTHLIDLSRISVAGTKRIINDLSTVNDTGCSIMVDSPLQSSGSSGRTDKILHRDVLKKAAAGLHYRMVYDEICPKEAKKAGNFLDGCNIFLSGFRDLEREKLNRILNVGGATRYDTVNEQITHIIVGHLDDKELKAWKNDNLLTSVHIVRLDWLLESIKQKQPANEAVYRVPIPTNREPDAPSPSSKKTLRSMNHSFKQPEKPVKKQLFTKNSNDIMDVIINDMYGSKPLATSTELPLAADERELIAQYSEENLPSVFLPQLSTDLNGTAGVLSVHSPLASSTQRLSKNNGAKDEALTVIPLAKQQAPTQLQSNITDGNTAITIDYENLDFFQGMSVYVDVNHFPDEFYTQIISECEAAHGNIVTANYRDPVDYAIVSFERTLNESLLPVRARNIVTELYVESCLNTNKLVPIEYYHKHIPHTADVKPLVGMTIVISIYALLERDFITSIAELLGANVNKNFVKKETPLLICPSPQGSKYEGAIKWQYPVVKSEWLLACATEGRKMSYLPYLVGESSEDFPTSPSMSINKRIEPQVSIDSNINDITYNNPPILDTFTPLRNKRVSELAVSCETTSKKSPISDHNSPHTPLNQSTHPLYNFDFIDRILADIENEDERECLKEVINEMKNNQTPEIERIKRQACTPINRKIPTPKGIPDFCTTPEFERRMADVFERRWRLPTKKIKPDTPIDEIRRRVMKATCMAMGIPYTLQDEDKSINEREQTKRNFEDTVTLHHKHMQNNIRNQSPLVERSIYMSQNLSNNHVETPTSRNMNAMKSLMSPNCKSDTFVPNTQSPIENSTSASYGLGQRTAILEKSTINFDKISFEESASRNMELNKSTSSHSPEIQRITDYLRDCESRRETFKRTRLSSELSNIRQIKQLERESHEQKQVAEVPDTEMNHHIQPFESEKIHTEEMVGWRDPAEFEELRRSRPIEDLMQFSGTPRFSISCSDVETRDAVIAKILQLGGEVCENLVNFDSTCTHFVCERPNRGEKILGCISSGKWILSINYIEECFARETFINEELYEWSNPKALNLPQLTNDEQIIGQASYRWRQRLSTNIYNNQNHEGAFHGFVVIFHTSERNIQALKNVIRAGKGVVVEATTPYNQHLNINRVTHCFVDAKKIQLNREDYDFLKRQKILILTQIYINAYLMNIGDVDASKYEIQM